MNYNDWVTMIFRGEPIKKSFTLEEAEKIAEGLKIDFSKERFDIDQLLHMMILY